MTVNPKYADLTEQLSLIPGRFDKEGTLLYSGRNMVKVFKLGDREVVVKRYKVPILIQRFVYTFLRPGKAERAYRFGFEFLRRGFETPEPIAYIENKSGGLLRDSYFISARSEGTPLYDILVRPMDFPNEIAKETGSLMAQLHRNGIMHGDPNLNNVLLKTEPDGSRHYVLIDTNRSKFADKFSYKRICKNLMRLTHRRDLLPVILDGYSQNNVALKHDVLKELEAFEKRKSRKYKIKNKLKLT